jgi:hypothetical protein
MQRAVNVVALLAPLVLLVENIKPQVVLKNVVA